MVLDRQSMQPEKNINGLAAEVLKRYNITPESITLIQGGSIKTVWKVKARQGHLCLKRLRQTYDKALFSVNAQIYIYKCGGNVPQVIPDRENQPIVRYNDQLFVLYEWLQGKDLNFNNSADFKMAVTGLAGFHAASRGYKPCEGARISTKLAKWPEQYESMNRRMTAWKEAAKKESKNSSSGSYLNCIDGMLELAGIALELLDKTDYKELTGSSSQSIVLCHQDYGTGNAILTDKGVFVIDLDGVTYDLPARDLRKIIGKQAENKNDWNKSNLKSIISWYDSVNPISRKEREILYADLMFPHWFFGLVKNRFDKNKPVKASEIERIAKLEKAKVPVLTDLLRSGE
jgi:spore coat protein I